jgi:hypothetical protein
MLQATGYRLQATGYNKPGHLEDPVRMMVVSKLYENFTRYSVVVFRYSN